jgi:sugar phosphate isomerase/epimerase
MPAFLKEHMNPNIDPGDDDRDRTWNRRSFLRSAAGAAVVAGLVGPAASASAQETAGATRKFTICLACGTVGIPDDPALAIARARQFGFESIEPSPQFLGKLSDPELQDYLGRMRDAKLVWGAAGLPVDIRRDDAVFENDLRALPQRAAALQRAGATRTATWLSPTSSSLTYVANFRLHAKRLREVAKVLGDHGVRLGLEYVAPKTSWSARRYPFIHTMAEMKDLLAEIGSDNVAFLLDTWHWYTAQETVDDLLTLRGRDVVLIHMNDAPAGVPVEQQVDNRRGLPCSTGVIDMKAFLGAMVRIGYDGPLVCEPFSRELRGKPPEEVLATVAASMKKAVALVE